MGRDSDHDLYLFYENYVSGHLKKYSSKAEIPGEDSALVGRRTVRRLELHHH